MIAWLRVAYEQLKARLGWRVARVAAARRLVRIVYVMVCSREPWGGTQELTTSGTRSTPNLSARRPPLH